MITNSSKLSFNGIPFCGSEKQNSSGKYLFSNFWDNFQRIIYDNNEGIDNVLGEYRMKTINEGWYMQHFCDYLKTETEKDMYIDMNIVVSPKFEKLYQNSGKCDNLNKFQIFGRILRASNYLGLDFEKELDRPPTYEGVYTKTEPLINEKMFFTPFIFLGYSIIEKLEKGIFVTGQSPSDVVNIEEKEQQSIWFSPNGYFVNNDYEYNKKENETYEMVRFDEKNGYFRFLKRQEFTGWININHIPNIGGKKKRKSNKKKRKNHNRKRTNRKHIIRK